MIFKIIVLCFTVTPIVNSLIFYHENYLALTAVLEAHNFSAILNLPSEPVFLESNKQKLQEKKLKINKNIRKDIRELEIEGKTRKSRIRWGGQNKLEQF